MKAKLATTEQEKAQPDMKLEVVLLGVSDVDRSKAFYQNLGWRLDGDFTVGDGFRAVQMTPYHSGASIIFGKGIASSKPGTADGLVLAVDDVAAAREDLVGRGVNVSEVFHYAGGPFNVAVENARVDGPDPEGRSYFSFASFEDPDGNGWILQEIGARFPGREWEPTAEDVANLAELLRETEQHHGQFEATHAEHRWSDWYAPYLSARQQGRSPEEAAAAADRRMEDELHVLAR